MQPDKRRELRTWIEVGVLIYFGWIIPGVLIVLAIDCLIRWAVQ